jgi:outer membrane lipoprotein-sorting protein
MNQVNPVKWIVGMVIVAAALAVTAQETPPGEAILREIDANMSSESRILTSTMIIHARRGSRTVRSRTWAEGELRAFTHYLSPPREKGTKMLKLDKKLWVYSPSTDRTIQISGHMLRQSVMGSDLSYEDMLEDSKLLNHYIAEVTGIETLDRRPCWVLRLTAKTADVAYHTRRLWVDRDRFIPLRQELFAKSGNLIKKLELSNVVTIQGRWYPTKMVFKDMLKAGKGTEFIIDEIRFDEPIPPHFFSKASLRK